MEAPNHNGNQLAQAQLGRQVDPGPPFSRFVLGLPHVTLIELQLALISNIMPVGVAVCEERAGCVARLWHGRVPSVLCVD